MFSACNMRLLCRVYTGSAALSKAKSNYSIKSRSVLDLCKFKYVLSPKAPCLVYFSRSYSNYSKKQAVSDCNLTSMPNYVWPNLIKTAKNFLLGNFLLPSMDDEFHLRDFYKGSLQAIEIVSSHIANNEFDQLEGLVADNVINEIRTNLPHFTYMERLELNVTKDDVYMQFPYEIGILHEKENKGDGRHVEITMVYHVLKDYKPTQEAPQSPFTIMTLPDFEKRLRVLNYRFIRKFAGSGSSEWVINALNHFKPLTYNN